MNIAHVLPYLTERFGGPVVVVKNVGGMLAAMGHDVSYWTTAGKKDREELASMDCAHIYDVVWPRSWRRSRDLVRGLSAEISSINIVHIGGLWLHPTYAASRIARANNTPYVLSPAGCLEPWRLRSNGLKWLKKMAYINLVGKSMMQGAACLQACSVQEADHFRQVGYRGPITVIPNGVDASEFSPGSGAEAESLWPDLAGRSVVLFMSRLSPEKGLDILIPIWAELVQSAAYKNALLVIAGPDDRGYRKVVEGMIDSCHAGSKILLTGMVRGKEKLSLLRRADVFVLPSYSENFGIVVVEALACGIPVITTTDTPWEQLQQVDAGRWVAPREPELAQALRELLDMSESKREAMGHHGRELVLEEYNWNKITRQLINVYHCILHGKDVPLYPQPTELNVE